MSRSYLITIAILIQLIFGSHLAHGQSYKELTRLARTSYHSENYSLSGEYWDKAFAINNGVWNEYYDAACSWSLAGQYQKSINYLIKAYQYGAFQDHFFILEDDDLDPIRLMPEYQELVKKYNAKIEDIIYLSDLVKLLLEKSDVTINNKIIILPSSAEANKAYFASLGYKDSVLSLPNSSLRLENCQLSYNYGIEHEGQFLLNNVELKRLEINKPKYDVGVKLDKIEFANCSFDQLVIEGVEIEVNLISSKVRELFYAGSYFELRGSAINEAYIEGENLAYVRIIDNTFNQTIRSVWTYEDGTNKPPLGISGKFSTLELINNKFYGADSLNPKGLIACNTNILKFRDNEFGYPVSFTSSVINNQLEIVNNKFNLIDFTETVFPENNVYIPFQQFDSSEIAIIRQVTGGSLDLHSIISNSKNEGFFEKENFEKLLYQYKRLYDNYISREEIESANLAYTTIQNLSLSRLKYISTTSGEFSNYFTWRKAQILIWHQRNRILSFSYLSLFIIFIGSGITWKLTRSKKVVLSEKRLAAIVFSDIVGYTQLMGKDERKAMKTINVNNAVHVTMLDRYNGRLLKEMGDGTLFSFGSASESVNFCIDVQKEIMLKDYKIRMGIHLGEVMFSKNDVFGDGVNIASRLQGKAVAGGICISDTVYQNIRNLPEIEVDFLGEGDLKNVTSKIKMYNVKY